MRDDEREEIEATTTSARGDAVDHGRESSTDVVDRGRRYYFTSIEHHDHERSVAVERGRGERGSGAGGATDAAQRARARRRVPVAEVPGEVEVLEVESLKRLIIGLYIDAMMVEFFIQTKNLLLYPLFINQN